MKPYRNPVRSLTPYLAFASILLSSCGGGESTSGAGSGSSLNEVDLQAIAMLGGLGGEWLSATKAIERRNRPQAAAYPEGLTVLGDYTADKPAWWIAGVLVHEECHHRHNRECSTEAEAICIRVQIEYDKTVGGYLADELEALMGVHTCP